MQEIPGLERARGVEATATSDVGILVDPGLAAYPNMSPFYRRMSTNDAPVTYHPVDDVYAGGLVYLDVLPELQQADFPLSFPS